jgi:hypothetical protein
VRIVNLSETKWGRCAWVGSFVWLGDATTAREVDGLVSSVRRIQCGNDHRNDEPPTLRGGLGGDGNGSLPPSSSEAAAIKIPRFFLD